jgi:predicted kinase
VLDNTNVTREERVNYIIGAKHNGYVIKGYYFESKLAICLKRNEARQGRERIKNVGIISKHKSLELPVFEEGFNELYYVTIENDQFKINEWSDEV